MRVAIVDDCMEDTNCLEDCLKHYQDEHSVSFQICTFLASFDFLEEYRGDYDIIFLDIEMPGTNGMDVAREIRTKDSSVGIIFITSMAQYAIEGYEVNAIDFIVKPVRYFSFSVKLDRALRFCQNHRRKTILIKKREQIQRIDTDEIYYIDKERDFLLFHTNKEDLKERGSLKDLKEELSDLPFAENMAGCLINLNYIKRIEKDMVVLLNGKTLPLSRRNKKKFTDDYIQFMGGL